MPARTPPEESPTIATLPAPERSAATAAPARLELRELSKSFGSSRALIGASLRVAPSEVHGLVGENGSGKSTLVKLLCGYHAPDPGGALLIDGERVPLPPRPATMRRLGLSVVHQDLGLLDSFTVVENMRAGQFGVHRLTRAIRWRRERELARQALGALGALGAEIDPDTRVGELSAAARAEVAIARALQSHSPGRGIVAFDESTRALPRGPRQHFHSLAREVASRGGSVLLVSHQLDEVLAHTDRVTVLRDGRVVAGGVPTSELSERELIRLMLGRELARPRRRTAEPARTAAGVGASRGASPASAVAASIHDLRGPTLAGASFSVGKGEVLGVTGLLGSGFEELPYLIAAARPASAGMLALDGLELDLARASPRAALDAGVALVPERRASDGLALGRSVIDNVTLPRVRTRGALAPIGRWQQAEAEWVLEHLGVRPADPHLPVAHLSGGNQQKVLLGKWLLGAPRLLVLHEPTQGVDVGARLDIERALVQATERGCGVILAGMDMPELASICDRVLVMRDGLPVAELAHQLSPERIIDAVYADGAGE